MTFLVVTETSLIFIMFVITFKILSCAHNDTATSNQHYISHIRLCGFDDAGKKESHNCSSKLDFFAAILMAVLKSKHLGRCFAQLISKELTIFL